MNGLYFQFICLPVPELSYIFGAKMDKNKQIEFFQKKIHELEKQLESENGDCLSCIENIFLQIRKYQGLLIERMEKIE